jgi:hypothetical protein
MNADGAYIAGLVTAKSSENGTLDDGVDLGVFDPKRWTLEGANALCARWLTDVANAEIGGIYDTLNKAALVCGHFGDEFGDRGIREQQLLDAVHHTAYDPNGPSSWKAEDVIATGMRDGAREPYTLVPSSNVIELRPQVPNQESNFDSLFQGDGLRPALPAPTNLPTPEPVPVKPPEWPDDRFIDLRPFLTGTYTPPAPNVGARRNDGVRMLYPGRWHTVIGLTEAGKSLFAIWQAIETMQAGGVVVYLHFEEIGEHAAGGLIDRLRTFSKISGLDNDTIAAKFFPLSCERPWAAGELSAALARLPEAPALVVLDGINEAAGQLGGDVEKTTSITLYRKHLVTPATAVGAAVLSLGHPVKARSRQDERHSYGSTAWLDAVDGVSFRLESSSTPIAKGRKGSSALSVVKDRYGEVKRNGQLASNREAGWFYLGQFVVDDTQPLEMGTAAYLTAPKPRAEGPQSLLGDDDDEDGSDEPSPTSGDDTTVLELLARLVTEHGRPMTSREIESSGAGMSAVRTRSALTRLELSKRLLAVRVSRGFRYTPSPSAGGEEVAR